MPSISYYDQIPNYTNDTCIITNCSMTSSLCSTKRSAAAVAAVVAIEAASSGHYAGHSCTNTYQVNQLLTLTLENQTYSNWYTKTYYYTDPGLCDGTTPILNITNCYYQIPIDNSTLSIDAPSQPSGGI